MEFCLCLPNIGPTVCQFRWQTNRHRRRYQRNTSSLHQFGIQSAGGGTHQQIDGIDLHGNTLLILRNNCIGPLQFGLCAIHIQFTYQTTFVTRLTELQQLGCGIPILGSNAQLLLQAAQGHVIGGQFGLPGNQNPTTLFHGGVCIRFGCLVLSTHTPPQVDLPTGLHAILPVVQQRNGGLGGLAGQHFA